MFIRDRCRRRRFRSASGRPPRSRTAWRRWHWPLESGRSRSSGRGRGGEVKQYTKLVEDSRRHALDRMIENARIQGANAIVSMRFDSSEVGQTLTEIVAYGTAVVVGPRR